MSQLIDKIKADALAARKAREGDKGVFLTTLASDAAMAAKNDGNREPTDADALAACARFDKGLAEMLRVRPDDAKSLAERAWLRGYMPEKLDEASLDHLIGEIMQSAGLASVGPKDMGKIMGGLKLRAAGQFDGEMAKALIKRRQEA